METYFFLIVWGFGAFPALGSVMSNQGWGFSCQFEARQRSQRWEAGRGHFEDPVGETDQWRSSSWCDDHILTNQLTVLSPSYEEWRAWALQATVRISVDKTEIIRQIWKPKVGSFEGFYAWAGRESLAEPRLAGNFTIFSCEYFCPAQSRL